jgi:hypothetical protein
MTRLRAYSRRASAFVAAVAVAVATLACGSGASTPSPTTPTVSTVPVTTAAEVMISGIVTATQTGVAVPFAYVRAGTSQTEADASGQFSIMTPGIAVTNVSIGMSSDRISSGAPPYVEHVVPINTLVTRSGLALNIIQDTAPFSDSLYREFVHDAYDAPPGNEALRRWTINPSFYIRTAHVETGTGIPAVIVSELETMFRNSVPELSGGKFSVATIETGTASRAARDGWVNVLFQSVLPTPGAGGQSTVGGNSGTMWLQFDPADPKLLYGGTACSFATGAAEHEIVHTMGFWHVGPIAGVDKPFQSPDFCSGKNRPEIIRYHAAIAYSRPVGNTFPDIDPASALALSPASAGPTIGCLLAKAGAPRR